MELNYPTIQEELYHAFHEGRYADVDNIFDLSWYYVDETFYCGHCWTAKLTVHPAKLNDYDCFIHEDEVDYDGHKYSVCATEDTYTQSFECPDCGNEYTCDELTEDMIWPEANYGSFGTKRQAERSAISLLERVANTPDVLYSHVSDIRKAIRMIKIACGSEVTN